MDSQPHQGTGTQRVDSLKPKKKTRGAWGDEWTFQTRKLAQVVKEFDEYKLDNLGVHET